MAKRRKPLNDPGDQVSPGSAPTVTPTRSVFTNSIGRKFSVWGISPFTLDQIRIDLIERWRLDGHPYPTSPPDVPTYDVETVGGGKETFPLDEAGLDTDEEKGKWSVYQFALGEYNKTLKTFENEYNTELSKELFQSVDVDPSQDKEWVDRCEYRKTILPVNRFELKELYVKTWVIRSVGDIPKLMSSILVTSELATEEAIQSVEDSFRSQLSSALRGASSVKTASD